MGLGRGRPVGRDARLGTICVERGAGLVGSIPPELGNLSSLEELDLSRNSRLTGRIPLEVWNLWSAGVLQDADVRGTSLHHPLGECEGRVFWRFLECHRPIE